MMATPSPASGRAKRKRTVTEDGNASLSRKKAEPEPDKTEKNYTFRVLLPNGSNLTLTLENPDEEMSVQELVRTVKRKCEKEEIEKGSRRIQWGNQPYLEDTMGNKLKNGKIIPLAAANKTTTLILQDGGVNSVHTYQDMWDVTPEPHLLVDLPQEYTLETALADLIDNSLQAVWANGSSERRLISVKIGNREISIFDSGQGMDGSKENSIAKWGTMGSSNHRAVRADAVGGKPPYLKPYFGMYGFGGLAASMHLGGVVMVSSKTKTSKKVVTLSLERESLVQRSKSDRIWRTPGDIREVSQEEKEMSPHSSFTKVHISKLKSQYWKEDQLRCMLKDIYFPYIQNDGSDESVRTSTPVEFEVNGTNLTEVAGGEVVATMLAACNAPPFVLQLHFECPEMNGTASKEKANAKLSCFYFPIIQGKESIDAILEKLKIEERGLVEDFETFCRVSIRRLGRLLPDARWGRLPFMDPKRRRTESTQIPQQSYKRVKCFVETDAGFAPTTSKTDLAHKHPFTIALKNLGRKNDTNSTTTQVEIEREGKPLSLVQLEKEYQEWIRAMHESYDEEVECCDEQAVLILNPSNGRDLGISNNVVRVLTQIRRKGQLWKASQRIKILKGDAAGKDLYATLEYILCEGFEGDPGEARMICRSMECPEESGSKLVFNNGNASFELGMCRSLPLDLISSGKCQAVDEEAWTRQLQKKRLKAPAFIDILNTEQVRKFDVEKGFPRETVQAGFDLPKEIIAVVRPRSFTASTDKSSDGSDQKSIVKDSREMKMDIIKTITRNECSPENLCGSDVTMQTKATSRKGVHGLYCFAMEGSCLLEMFTKAGRYRFIFSMVNGLDSNTLCTEVELCVEASDKVGDWKLSHQLSDLEGTELKRSEARLGHEFGPIYISCYDVYSNRMSFKTYPQLEVRIEKMGKTLELKIDKASGNLTPDRMHMKVRILLGKGKLDLLRPSFEASLIVGSKDSCFAEMPVTVLPGDLSSVEILSKQELDKCLRPEDVINDFQLQALDAYGNPVEKGQTIKVELTGLKFQDQSDLHRKVDDQGSINFGGLLKVTGNYGSKGCIRVCSDSHIMLEKHFEILTRELKVISEIPEESYAGSTLENVMFGIFDDDGNIDEEMDGRQHSLTIDLCPHDGVQYPFRKGRCTVSKLQLPAEHGTLEFKAYHSFHPELVVFIKIELLPCRSLELVSFPEQGLDDRAVCRALAENGILDPHPNNQMTVVDSVMRSRASYLLGNIKKWQEDLRRRGQKVAQDEDRLKPLEKSKSDLEAEIDELTDKLANASKGDGKIRFNQGSHNVEQTVDEIIKQGNSAGALWVELSSRHHIQSLEPPVLPDVIGVVALLGKVETDLLSWALSEYLGKENMLAIVCKSHEAVERIEQYDHTGKLIALSGIHGLASVQRRHIDGRFRVICLDDLRSYEGGCKFGDPQKQLIIDDPKLENGSLPAGFIGYAVNMIKLDPENLHSSASGVRLRETLFFNLFSYLQVYETRNHMLQAMCCIRGGAISLDGGILRCKGIIECGNREEVAVRFPTTSSKPLTSLNQQRLCMEEKLKQKLKEKKKIEDEIKRASTGAMKSRQKFEQKARELEELEAEAANVCSLVKSDSFDTGPC